ncbi:unnamed protein product [Ceratitis capitata]|uniref:(Mediterranean fruit fly) hypothetical protein n=1 Tax=Ceratitis capitata TaxID=7213 RepID=A0A811VDK8_CERCA|nr:unnamed protein product [Ceratitis capitata]
MALIMEIDMKKGAVALVEEEGRAEVKWHIVTMKEGERKVDGFEQIIQIDYGLYIYLLQNAILTRKRCKHQFSNVVGK